MERQPLPHEIRSYDYKHRKCLGLLNLLYEELEDAVNEKGLARPKRVEFDELRKIVISALSLCHTMNK